jgi:hypothetical protein
VKDAIEACEKKNQSFSRMGFCIPRPRVQLSLLSPHALLIASCILLMQLWTPPSHRLFMSTFMFVKPTSITNTLFGALFLALDRLQQPPPGNGTRVVGEGVAMADPAAVECVIRHWTLGDSQSLLKLHNRRYSAVN